MPIADAQHFHELQGCQFTVIQLFDPCFRGLKEIRDFIPGLVGLAGAIQKPVVRGNHREIEDILRRIRDTRVTEDGLDDPTL